jgi:glucokinase
MLKHNSSAAITTSPSPIMSNSPTLIGVDLGGTKLHVARSQGAIISSQSRAAYNAQASAQAVLDTLIAAIAAQLTPQVTGIGVGVPSVVDPELGIVYETVNIPAWRELPLKAELEQHFGLPVRINNDVNCFALGEYHYGRRSNCRDLVGISLGTGMGVGLILNGQLYAGHSCGAGELGELPYLDGTLENYCSGEFFQRHFGCDGTQAFVRASRGEPAAMAMYEALGTHLAQALSAVLLAYNPQLVVLGGSVSQAFPFFSDALNRAMESFPFQSLWRRTRLEISQNSEAAVLGAAALLLI